MLHQMAETITGTFTSGNTARTFIALAAAGTLAASAVVSSQGELAGLLGGVTDLGWGASDAPITTDVSLQGLLPAADGAHGR